MKRERFIAIITMLIGLFCITGLSFAAEEKAEEIKVIQKIVVVETRAGLSPATLVSEPGTTVIWVNQSKQPAEILFTDKKATLACASPVNFFIGKDGAYESAKIPFGGTASLCFIEKGKFEYIYKASSTFYPLQQMDHKGILWIK